MGRAGWDGMWWDTVRGSRHGGGRGKWLQGRLVEAGVGTFIILIVVLGHIQ